MMILNYIYLHEKTQTYTLRTDRKKVDAKKEFFDVCKEGYCHFKIKSLLSNMTVTFKFPKKSVRKRGNFRRAATAKYCTLTLYRAIFFFNETFFNIP